MTDARCFNLKRSEHACSSVSTNAPAPAAAPSTRTTPSSASSASAVQYTATHLDAYAAAHGHRGKRATCTAIAYSSLLPGTYTLRMRVVRTDSQFADYFCVLVNEKVRQ